MSKFRKKPVVVEAMEFTPRAATSVATWCKGRLFDDPEEGGYIIYIDTLEGTMKANLGDWIIKGVNDEFYPCKPDIFEKTYEAIDE